jgi:hypothetical protein
MGADLQTPVAVEKPLSPADKKKPDDGQLSFF